MAFEKFTPKKGHHVYKEPTVSAWTDKFISITKLAADKFDLRKFSWCTLYYDKEENLIGIKFAETKTDKSQKKITTYPKNPGMTISIDSFLEETGLDLDGPAHYPATFDEEQGMLVVDLNKKMKTD